MEEIEGNRWLRDHNLTKRELNLVTLEEVGSGSFETTQFLTTISTKQTESLTTFELNYSTPISFTDSIKTTSIESSTLGSLTTQLTNLTSEQTTIKQETSIESSQTTADTFSVATSSLLATTPNFETISEISSKTSRISTSIFDFTKTTMLTQTTEIETTTSTENNLCTANDECLNVFGRSACVKNRCSCLLPTVLFENICTSNSF